MHKLTLVLLLAFFSAFGFSQNRVTGKIVDELGLPIYLASVEIDQTGEVVYTDYDGNFSLTSNKGFHWKINITSTGYKPESFFVLSNGKTESLVLEYDEKMKKLLNENSKLSNNTYGFLFKKSTLYFKLTQPLTH